MGFRVETDFQLKLSKRTLLLAIISTLASASLNKTTGKADWSHVHPRSSGRFRC
jgi:hypothetical protein